MGATSNRKYYVDDEVNVTAVALALVHAATATEGRVLAVESVFPNVTVMPTIPENLYSFFVPSFSVRTMVSAESLISFLSAVTV